MIEWFLERQISILVILGLASILIIIVVGDPRWPQVVAALIISLIFVLLGQRIYRADTTENWLSLRYGDILRNILSGVLCLLGWAFFIRAGLAIVIGAALLKMG